MKQIYYLPNLLTACNLFCGIFAIALAVRHEVFVGCALVIVSMVFDFLDGQVARQHAISSRFGREFDSLADAVSFGVAPGLLAYVATLSRTGRVGVAIFFVYSACTVLRLARYNTQCGAVVQRHFVGLPSPGAAGLVVAPLMLHYRYGAAWMLHVVPALMIAAAYLMISSVSYPLPSAFHARKKRPFLHLAVTTVAVSVAVFFTEAVAFALFVGYALFGLATDRMLRRVFSQKVKGIGDRRVNSEEARNG